MKYPARWVFRYKVERNERGPGKLPSGLHRIHHALGELRGRVRTVLYLLPPFDGNELPPIGPIGLPHWLSLKFETPAYMEERGSQGCRTRQSAISRSGLMHVRDVTARRRAAKVG